MDKNRFISAMGRAVTGVSVVTTDGPAGRLAQTVSAMCSVSADPPMVLACLNRRSPLCAAIEQNGVLCVNVLAADQAYVSDVFAGRRTLHAPYDFDCADWDSASSGAPVLAGAVAAFDCELAVIHHAATHIVVIGRVLETVDGDATPLLYSDRSYGQPMPIVEEVAA